MNGYTLTSDEIGTIRRLVGSGMTQAQIGQFYGVGQARISRFVRLHSIPHPRRQIKYDHKSILECRDEGLTPDEAADRAGCSKAWVTAVWRAAGKPYPRRKRQKHQTSYYSRNKDLCKAKAKERDRKIREKVIAHYGGNCQCCGESQYEFLSVDHIDGGGNRHRVVTGAKMARWLANNGMPAGFRVLCYNCNLARGFHGHCPHHPPVVIPDAKAEEGEGVSWQVL